MSYREVTPNSVLKAIRGGDFTRADLAVTFGVLPTSAFLSDALRALKECQPPQIVEHANGHLHVNDLIETLPHNEED